MNVLIKLFFIVGLSFFMIWAYTVNCLYFSDYVFTYSSDNYTRAFQYLVEGLWRIFSFFGWLLIIAIDITVIFALFPSVNKAFKYPER